ncbi:DUF1854 domain-containing protein [Parapusillimonas granuli]|uniref:DUF1854 domain-containing protein n=1 Tax=Parapusillimonas granuli TaxID=380911 RepID=A0A853FTB5_9BURK|nr:hypothetical protein [Parapusillimonas granuli]MEB2400525.1 DUF1854 domain-containing protein [Alcaligenaceae bacterium]NYT47928.1 DUF1854 domain-containing protein [Parapusillimonas granuli]
MTEHHTTSGGRLSRDAFGRLQLDRDGSVVTGLVPVRSFPITAPQEGISLVDQEGKEHLWVERLDALPADMRAVIEEELASREFIPEIQRIRGVSSFATPSRWQVSTDRGDTVLLLKAEEDIRRLSTTTLLIADGHGIQFLIRNLSALDKSSRKLLDHFL